MGKCTKSAASEIDNTLWTKLAGAEAKNQQNSQSSVLDSMKMMVRLL
jgi:hypothetical protein